MFGELSFEKVGLLLVLALFVLGPERLPAAVRQFSESFRSLRGLVVKALAEAQEGLGPEFGDVTLTDLQPRNLIKKYVLDEPDADGGASARYTPGMGSEPTRQVEPLLSDQPAPWDPDTT